MRYPIWAQGSSFSILKQHSFRMNGYAQYPKTFRCVRSGRAECSFLYGVIQFRLLLGNLLAR